MKFFELMLVKLLLIFQNLILALISWMSFYRKIDDTNPIRILLLGTSALGDFIFAVPAMVALRKYYPNVKIVLLTATAPIPRVIWPDKITPISFQFTQTFLGDIFPSDSGGVQSTLPGELYWNFHMAGILVGAFLVGTFCKFIYSYLLLHLNQSTLLIYTVVLIYMIWIVEAPTVHTITFLSQLAPIILTLFFITSYQLKGKKRLL